MAAKDVSKYRLGLSQKYMEGPSIDNYPVYNFPNNNVKTARHLTPEMYDKMYRRVTPNGVTVDKCIQCSVDYVGTNMVIGLLAGDEESYTTFNEIFDAVINDHHLGFGVNDKHPAPELDAAKLQNGQLDEKYVKSCRIRTGRSIRGICLPPAICRAERREVERTLVDALGELKGDLSGTYYPLMKMTKEQEKQLIADHFLFQKPTGHLMTNSTAVRDWPDGRGIWHNKEKTFLIWINEEDHCRIISMQKGGDMKGVFERFCRGLKEIEGFMKKKGREFMHSDRLGYLNACPSNIGTGIRCSAHIQLHNLCKDSRFTKICEGLKLQWRGTGGEHTEAVDDIYDISNAARLKSTEREFIQLVIDGLNKLIEMEKRLEEGKSIDDLVPK